MWTIMPKSRSNVISFESYCPDTQVHITVIIIILLVLSSWLGAIVRVHPVHLMNADWVPGGCKPSHQDNRLGLRVCQKLTATTRIHNHHLLLLLSPKADTHFTIPRRVEGWVDLGSAGRCSSCPRLHITTAVMINAVVKLDPETSHTAIRHVTNRPTALRSHYEIHANITNTGYYSPLTCWLFGV